MQARRHRTAPWRAWPVLIRRSPIARSPGVKRPGEPTDIPRGAERAVLTRSRRLAYCAELGTRTGSGIIATSEPGPVAAQAASSVTAGRRSVLSDPSRSVRPSGAASVTIWSPRAPPPPGSCSILTGWPMSFESSHRICSCELVSGARTAGKPAGAVHYRICRRRLLAMTTQAIGLEALAAKGEHMIKPERPCDRFQAIIRRVRVAGSILSRGWLRAPAPRERLEPKPA